MPQALTVPVLLVCGCGFTFRADCAAHQVVQGERRKLVPAGNHTLQGVALHELPLLHRALGRCGRGGQRLLVVQARRTGTVCDVRCFRSRGDECLCACGGRNHGAAYR